MPSCNTPCALVSAWAFALYYVQSACTTNGWGVLTILHTQYYRSNLTVTLVSLSMFVWTSVRTSAAAKQWRFHLCICSKIRPNADANVVYVLSLRLEICEVRQTSPGQRRTCKMPWRTNTGRQQRCLGVHCHSNATHRAQRKQSRVYFVAYSYSRVVSSTQCWRRTNCAVAVEASAKVY